MDLNYAERCGRLRGVLEAVRIYVANDMPPEAILECIDAALERDNAQPTSIATYMAERESDDA